MRTSGQPELTSIVKVSWCNFCPKQPDISLKPCRSLKENEHFPLSSFEILKVAPGCPWLSSGIPELELLVHILPLWVGGRCCCRCSCSLSMMSIQAQPFHSLRPEPSAQFVTTTCLTSVFFELQDSYSWLLCLSLPWAVLDHLVHTGKPRPTLQVPASVAVSWLVILKDCFQHQWTHFRNWVGSWISCGFYNYNKQVALGQAALW